MAKTVGFLGLGAMGAPMAWNIHKGGYALRVHNRTLEKAEPFRKEGIPVESNPRQLAEACDVIVVMVSDPHALRASVMQQDGLLEGLRPGTTVINMSTVSRESVLQIEAAVQTKEGRVLDCPVSGTVKPAKEGQLAILASGDKELVDEMSPLLETMGKKIFYCGELGQGTAMKFVVNLVLGGLMATLSEAVVLGRKEDIDMDTFFEILNGGPLGSAFMKMKGEMIRSGNFEKQFPVDLLLKDMNLILESAGDHGTALPTTASIREIVAAARGMGYGDEDMAAMVKVLQSTAGLPSD